MKNAAFKACLIAVAIFVISFAGTAVAGEKVDVKFTDGKTVVAELDERTNEDRLVLRFATKTSVLLRSMAWKRVVSVVPVAIPKGSVSKLLQSKSRVISNSAKPTIAELATEVLADSPSRDN